MTARIIEVAEGGIWELPTWEIHFNYELSRYSDRCRHCHKEGDAEVCPRVVVQKNEGGHASTWVCMDCIIETDQAIKLQDKIHAMGKVPMSSIEAQE